MNNEHKAQTYRNLMFEYDLLQNKINDIKSQNFELNETQMREIKGLTSKQGQIMQMVNNLMNK